MTSRVFGTSFVAFERRAGCDLLIQNYAAPDSGLQAIGQRLHRGARTNSGRCGSGGTKAKGLEGFILQAGAACGDVTGTKPNVPWLPSRE